MEILERCDFDRAAYLAEGNALAARFGDYLQKMHDYYAKTETPHIRIVADYVAGMTDDYTIECIQEIMVPKRFGIQFGEFL